MREGEKKQLRKVGAMWTAREGARSTFSGEVTIEGKRQRFLVFVNDHKAPGSRQPDYVLRSSDDPTVDDYRPPEDQPARQPAPADGDAEPVTQLDDSEIPF